MEGRDRVENGRKRSGCIGVGEWKGEIGCSNRGGRLEGRDRGAVTGV